MQKFLLYLLGIVLAFSLVQADERAKKEELLKRMEQALCMRDVARANYASSNIAKWQKVIVSSPESLQSGDVVLFEKEGDYFHAALGVGAGKVAERTREGGRIVAVSDLSDTTVFRNQNQDSASEAAEYARSSVASWRYDFDSIPLPEKYREFYRLNFESELVGISGEFVNFCLSEHGIGIVDKSKFYTSADNPFHKLIVSPVYLGYALGDFGKAKEAIRQRQNSNGMELFARLFGSQDIGMSEVVAISPEAHGKMKGISLCGVVYDPDTKEIFLLGKNAPALSEAVSFHLDDFVMALQIAYQKRAVVVCKQCHEREFECCKTKKLAFRYFVKDHHTPLSCSCCQSQVFAFEEDPSKSPSVTIDPIKGIQYMDMPEGTPMVVRLLGGIDKSNMGDIIFKGDYCLKWLSVGKDDKGKEFTSKHPKFQNMIDLHLAMPESGMSPWDRFWIQPDKIVTKAVGEKWDDQEESVNEIFGGHDPSDTQVCGMVFDKIAMAVLTENMVMTDQGLSGKGVASKAASEFAQFMTNNYDAMAKEFPIFAGVREQAKLVAIARWMFGNKIPVSHEILENYDLENHAEIPVTVPSIKNQKVVEEKNIRKTQKVCGGVRLHVDPANVQCRNLGTKEMQRIFHERPSSDAAKWAFEYGKSGKGIVINVPMARKQKPYIESATEPPSGVNVRRNRFGRIAKIQGNAEAVANILGRENDPQKTILESVVLKDRTPGSPFREQEIQLDQSHQKGFINRCVSKDGTMFSFGPESKFAVYWQETLEKTPPIKPRKISRQPKSSPKPDSRDNPKPDSGDKKAGNNKESITHGSGDSKENNPSGQTREVHSPVIPPEPVPPHRIPFQGSDPVMQIIRDHIWKNCSKYHDLHRRSF